MLQVNQKVFLIKSSEGIILANGLRQRIGEKMTTELEKQIRDLRKELAEVQMEKTALRLQPCRGDSEIRKKDVKFDELDSRAKTVDRTIQKLERKRQVLIAQSTIKRSSC